MTKVVIKGHQAVEVIHGIKAPWIIHGGTFFNDYATLHMLIDGKDTPNRLVLHRDGTWQLEAEVELK